MANSKLTPHRTDSEPHNTYPTKPKWNAFSTEILLCRIPHMLTVTPVPSATRRSVMKGKLECKKTVFKFLTVPNFILTCDHVDIFLEPLTGFVRAPCK